MRRGGNATLYRELIDRARTRVPDIAVRSTFIVGFPGEGESEFDELVDFVNSVRFDHMGVFTYSWQEENPGSDLGDPVEDEVKEARRSILMEAQQAVSLDHNERLVGRTLSALVSGPLQEMELLTEARLRRQAPEIDGRLLINDGTAPLGSLVDVEITDAHPYDLVGRLVRVVSPGPGGRPELPVLA
jgi:ribosomal protein S12 methylthiotransferase